MKNKEEADKLNRNLQMNDYDTAYKTFHTISNGLFKDIYPDGYILEMSGSEGVIERLEKF